MLTRKVLGASAQGGRLLRRQPAAGAQLAGTILARAHGGHGHSHGGGDIPAEAAAQRVVFTGLLADFSLAVGKVAGGLYTGSAALISDGAHSVADMCISAFTMWSRNYSKRGANVQHPYGHGRMETLGAAGIAAALLATSGGIAVSAVQSVLKQLEAMEHAATTFIAEHGHHLSPEMLSDPKTAAVGAGICIASLLSKEVIYRQTIAIGMKLRSQVLIANAWHHRTDSLSSFVALLGVGGAYMGLPVLDPLAAGVVAVMIGKAGLDTGIDAVRELLDERLDDDVIRLASDAARAHPRITAVLSVRARRMGPSVLLDMQLGADPRLTIAQADQSAEAVRRAIFAERPDVSECLIRFNPVTAGTAAGSNPDRRHGWEMLQRAEGVTGCAKLSAGVSGAGATSPSASAELQQHDHDHEHDHDHAPGLPLLQADMQAVTARVRAALTGIQGVKAISFLDVHAESASSPLLHVHARLVLDMSLRLSEGMRIVKRAKADLAALQIPINLQDSGKQSSGSGGSAKPAAGAAASEKLPSAWRVVEADVQVEPNPV